MMDGMPKRATWWWLALAVVVIGCDPGKLCPNNPECTKGAKCWCDDAGRLIQEERDDNGDKRPDRVTFERDGQGRVTTKTIDWSKNGSVERRQDFTYDAEGRRLTNKGWMVKCEGERFLWSCTYEEPCPPPYDKCAPCRKTYELEHEDGTREPLIGMPGGG